MGGFARVDEDEPEDEEALIYGHLSLARDSHRQSRSQISLQNREQQAKAQMSDAFAPLFPVAAPKSTEKNQLIPRQYSSKTKRSGLYKTPLEPGGKKQFSGQRQWEDGETPFPIALGSLPSPHKILSRDLIYESVERSISSEVENRQGKLQIELEDSTRQTPARCTLNSRRT